MSSTLTEQEKKVAGETYWRCDKGPAASLHAACEAVKAMQSDTERDKAQREASIATKRADCVRALTALSAAGICTPEETYGTNTGWAISDLCRAVNQLAALRKAAQDVVDCHNKSQNLSCDHQECIDALKAALGAQQDPDTKWLVKSDPEVGFVARSFIHPWITGHGKTKEEAIKMASETLEELRCPNCGMPDGDRGKQNETPKATQPQHPAPEPLMEIPEDLQGLYLDVQRVIAGTTQTMLEKEVQGLIERIGRIYMMWEKAIRDEWFACESMGDVDLGEVGDFIKRIRQRLAQRGKV